MAEGESDMLQGTLDRMPLTTLGAIGPIHGCGIARRTTLLLPARRG